MDVELILHIKVRVVENRMLGRIFYLDRRKRE
jgi:hypothetical protein